jgi:hypothetical protein
VLTRGAGALCATAGGLPVVSAASAPSDDAGATLARAAPLGVPLHAALAAAAATPHAHAWVADGAAAAAAKRLLDARRRQDAQRQAATARAAAVAARTSFSNACEIMQSACADTAAAEATLAAAQAVAAGSVPVFCSRATMTLSVALPSRGCDGEEGGSQQQLRSFRPWFFSLAQLERARILMGTLRERVCACFFAEALFSSLRRSDGGVRGWRGAARGGAALRGAPRRGGSQPRCCARSRGAQPRTPRRWRRCRRRVTRRR